MYKELKKRDIKKTNDPVKKKVTVPNRKFSK